MADNDRLTCERIGFKTTQEYRQLRDVLHGSKFTINSFSEHHIFDHVCFGNTEGFGLFRDLLIYQRCTYKAGADNIGANIVFCAFLCDDLSQTDQTMFGRNVGSFQRWF